MHTEAKKGISVKLFIGAILSPDLRDSLDHNARWKQARVTLTSVLTEIQFQNKPYIGLYLDEGDALISDIRLAEVRVREKLQEFCPKQNSDQLKVVLFPQVFLI